MVTCRTLKIKLISVLFLTVIFCWSSSTFAGVVALDTKSPTTAIGRDAVFFEDPSGELSIKDVMSIPDVSWQACQTEANNFGYTTSAYWFRVAFSNRLSTPAQRFVEIAYPVLDHINVYFIKKSEVTANLRLGDKYPFKDRVIQHRNFIFPVKLNPDSAVDIYIRVKTSSSMQIPLFIKTDYDILEESQSRLLEFGLYYGTMIVMAIYNLFVFISVRERSYLYYVIYVSAMCTFIASINGISYQFLWPNSIWWNDQAIIVSLSAVILFALLFSRHFLDLPASSPRLDKFCEYAILYGSVFLLFSLHIPYRYAIILVILNSMLQIVLTFCIGLYRLKQRYSAAKFFLSAWAAIFAGGIILALNKLGILPRNGFTENAVQFGSAAEVILLSFALADRLNTEKTNRYQAQQNALKHEKEAREAHELALMTQKKANETLELNVSIRTKELEEANTKLKELSITDGLTKLNNRRYFNEIYNSEFLRAFREKNPLSFLIIDIDHFKQFNDTYGHITGDECLTTVAQAIKSQLQRDNDFIARYGGEEFCILLPNTVAEGAYNVAEGIRKHIEALSFTADKNEIKITVSIGVATEVPASKEEANNLLSKADKALYQSKAQGRNMVTLYSDA